ncbi:MAG: methyltransferase [Candidatus Methanomethylicia archaeon]|nr:methyltransferase [Candidatus Methanomethylicia archaeon]MDW7988974.1 methyltransferase [Nitrososphaerota archaeon]
MKERKVNICGIDVIVFPKVYFPSDDTYMLVDVINSLDRNYGCGLDLGCGCGILTLLLSKICKQVIAIDINSIAVKNTWYNAKLNFLSKKIHVIVGDLINPIKRAPIFDIIVFNPPYLPASEYDKYLFEEEKLSLCGGPNGRIIIDRFLNEFSSIIKNFSEVFILQSSLSNHMKTIEKLINLGFNVSIVFEKKFFYEKLYLFKVTKNDC